MRAPTKFNTCKQGRPQTCRRAYRDFVEEGIARGKRPQLPEGGLVRSMGGRGAVKSLRRLREHAQGDEHILVMAITRPQCSRVRPEPAIALARRHPTIETVKSITCGDNRARERLEPAKSRIKM